MSQHKRRLTYLLMLAMLVLPWQSLYAQTSMPASSQPHECQHAKADTAEHDHMAMPCCDQDADHCQQNCNDCFHCHSLNTVTSVIDLQFERFYPRFSLTRYNVHSGLPPAAQYRPPRSHI